MIEFMNSIWEGDNHPMFSVFPCNGSDEDQVNYCSKEGNVVVEFGERIACERARKISQGSRTDLEDIRDELREGEDIDVLREKVFLTVRAVRALLRELRWSYSRNEREAGDSEGVYSSSMETVATDSSSEDTVAEWFNSASETEDADLHRGSCRELRKILPEHIPGSETRVPAFEPLREAGLGLHTDANFGVRDIAAWCDNRYCEINGGNWSPGRSRCTAQPSVGQCLELHRSDPRSEDREYEI